MARFKARVVGLVTVAAIAIGVATLSFWQEDLLTVQAAQENSTYEVEKGDSLYTIAKKLDVSLEALAAANGLVVNAPLNIKQELIIPSAESSEPAMQDAWALSEAQATGEATEEPTAEMVQEATPEATAYATEETMDEATPVASPTPVIYRVKAGDSLWTIAKKYGVSPQALAAANGLKPNSGLTRGQELIIPLPGTTTGSTDAVALPAPLVGEATPEATEAWAEATAEPTEEAMKEATSEATEEATAEVTEEATAEAMEEATPEATEEMTAEATAAATEEAMEEATPEATEEVMEEATAEATEAVMEEATPEATEEMTEEPTAEATEEATEEPTDEVAEEANILDTITELGNFTTLLETLESAGLTETLTTEGPFTLFAPTDAAFAALPEGTVDGLLASSVDDLSQILLYHLVPGELLSADLTDGTTIVTAQGGTITVTVTPDGIKINDATITITDIQTSNGVIHVIDAVLLPSENMAAVPIGMAAPATIEAASLDAASVIIVPVNITDTTAAAQLWAEPASKIALYSPVAEEGYHSPVEIIGLSHTFEGNVAIHLIAADGTLLAQRMTLGGAEAYAFFQSSLRFHVDQTTEATLHIIEMDMADGSMISNFETPITLLPGQRVIDVNSPVVGQAVCNPILVSGYSNTFEANVVLTLSEPSGDVVAQMPTIGGTMGTYRDFAAALPYTVTQATPLLLSVAETDASGILSTIDETVLPVTLYPNYSSACY